MINKRESKVREKEVIHIRARTSHPEANATFDINASIKQSNRLDQQEMLEVLDPDLNKCQLKRAILCMRRLLIFAITKKKERVCDQCLL